MNPVFVILLNACCLPAGRQVSLTFTFYNSTQLFPSHLVFVTEEKLSSMQNQFAHHSISFVKPSAYLKQRQSLALCISKPLLGGVWGAVKFSLLNPAIVVLPTVFKRALTKTQQHGVCT
jgi:hypothetical protein